MTILKGITGIFGSKKGTMSIIILISATVLAAIGKLDSTAFSAVVSVISTIFMWTAHKTDIANIQSGKAPGPTNIT